jgi:hypothetical protein
MTMANATQSCQLSTGRLCDLSEPEERPTDTNPGRTMGARTRTAPQWIRPMRDLGAKVR